MDKQFRKDLNTILGDVLPKSVSHGMHVKTVGDLIMKAAAEAQHRKNLAWQEIKDLPDVRQQSIAVNKKFPKMDPVAVKHMMKLRGLPPLTKKKA